MDLLLDQLVLCQRLGIQGLEPRITIEPLNPKLHLDEASSQKSSRKCAAEFEDSVEGCTGT